MKVTADVNTAECILKKTNFGYDTVHNICDGTQRIVEWGAGDWFGAAALGTLIGFVWLIIVALIWSFVVEQVREWRWRRKLREKYDLD